MRKRVIVLGSTGSIGRNALSVLEGLRDEWDVVGLAAGSRWESLAEQARQWNVPAIAIAEGTNGHDLNAAVPKSTTVYTGSDALARLVDEVECDCVIVAVVGVEALHATMRAAELGRRIALANKEALVIAGSVLVPTAQRHGATIIPIDSEHSAVFQALQAGQMSEVANIYLTASGGPFRTWSLERMDSATLEDALQHPTWDMGPKITIDSATMMNKALEIVEARWLFDIASERIQVVIHPESVIHSLVEFRDGSMIAQLGTPDMRTPIQYALTYPQRVAGPADRLDLSRVTQLNLAPPDERRFPSLRLGHHVARTGGTSGAVLNAANEAAVALFRKGAFRFTDIARHVEQALNNHEVKRNANLEDLLAADRWARQEITRCMAC